MLITLFWSVCVFPAIQWIVEGREKRALQANPVKRGRWLDGGGKEWSVSDVREPLAEETEAGVKGGSKAGGQSGRKELPRTLWGRSWEIWGENKSGVYLKCLMAIHIGERGPSSMPCVTLTSGGWEDEAEPAKGVRSSDQ